MAKGRPAGRKESATAKERVNSLIVETLGKRIVSGDFAVGESLGSEITAGAAFGASRTATREALKILGAKGLIQSRPRIGTIVQGREDWNLLDPLVLEWCLKDPGQSRRTMADFYEIRMGFEPYASSLAAKNHTRKDVLAMRRALRGMAHCLDSTDKAECDLAFHKAILHATGNSLYQAFGELISIGLRHLFRTGFEATAEEDEQWLRRHRKVADAIENGDVELSREEMVKLLIEAQTTQNARRSLPLAKVRELSA